MATKIVRENNYRNQLVQQIKDAGQEIIDRAEEMVDENTNYITNFSLNIYFPMGDLRPVPEISWTTDVLCRKTLDREKKRVG